MKVAIATEGNSVSHHFGHCEGFSIYEIENGEIKGNSFVRNPGHQPGFLPNYLNDLGVKVIIAGGMGGGAVQIFGEKRIEVITGVSGKVTEVVERYIKGQLESSGDICNDHQHSDSCGGHN